MKVVQCHLLYPASNELVCVWVYSEMEKWDRHGRWGRACLYHVLNLDKTSLFASAMFNDTFLIVFFFLVVVVCFIYLCYCTFNSWPMYQLVLCIQVYTELYVYIFCSIAPQESLL